MNIQTANRLYELRKKNGLSQEELADKLGISRQAVSKWERAEASPDTDNLILLAKLYGVTLDELLNKDNSIELVEEIEPKEEYNQKLDKITIENHGIHIESEDGEIVDVNRHGVHIIDSDGNETTKDIHELRHRNAIVDGIYGSIAILAVIAYLVLGFTTYYGWSCYWVVFLMIPVLGSIPEAIEKKRFTHFCYPVLVVAVYCFLGLRFYYVKWNIGSSIFYGFWHPGWILFLTIPVFYTIFKPIDDAIHKNDDEYWKEEE